MRACIENQRGRTRKEIAAMAFDSQMAGVGLIDEDFNPVGTFDSWLDMRCKPYIEWMDREAGERVTQLDRLPAHLRPRAQNAVVEERAARGVPANREVCHAGYLCGRQNGRVES